MFSKLQNMRNTGKRSTSQYYDQQLSQNQEEVEQEEEQSPVKHRFSPSEPHHPQSQQSSSTPPVLPPIPRVASQYGSTGPISLSELELKFGSFDGPSSSSSRPAAMPAPKPQASDLPFRRNEPDVRTQSYASPISTNSNYSRPLQAPPKPTPKPTSRPQIPTTQARAHTDPTTAKSNIKPASFPRSRSPEARPVRPPVRGTPRPPSQLRESFTAEIPVQKAPLQAPPPPPPPPPPLPPREVPLAPLSASRIESFPSTQQSLRPSSSSGSSSATLITPTTTVHPAKSSKPMLNRLNPMSYIGRRRSTQPESAILDSAIQKRNLMTSGSKLPDDYDPRIRGKVVHDFSAPRPKRFVSAQDLRPATTSRLQSGQNHESNIGGIAQGHKSSRDLRTGQPDRPVESERQHTPVFKEHFGEEIDGVWRYDENDPRNKVTTKILDRLPAEEIEKRSPLPPFAQRFTDAPKLPQATKSAPISPAFDTAVDKILERPMTPTLPAEHPLEVTESDNPPSVNAPKASVSPQPMVETSKQQQEEGSAEQQHSAANPAANDQQASPARSDSSPFSIEDTGFQPAGLPKHLQSNASRFSFDLAGVGSAAQEKLLEDKHRQRQARRARSSTVSGDSIAETNDESDYDDDMDMDDGLEEQIPGINTDDDDYQGFAGVSNSTLGPSLGATADGSGLGALSNSWDMSQPLQLQPDALGVYQMPNSFAQDSPIVAATDTTPTVMEAMNQLNAYEDDDDLYFDDGDIDTGEPEGSKFDESVFDDETSKIYGIPLRDQRPQPVNTDIPTGDSSQESTRPISSESGAAAANQARATADTSRTSVQPPDGALPVPKSSVVGRQNEPLTFNGAAGLTHDNLAAYHDALAMAASKAASEGRFDRKPNVENAVQGSAPSDQPRVSFNEQELGARMRPISDESGFKFDDEYDIDDDEFIAAANAEALENDDEGFYGQEFGFYAKAFDAEEALYMNGGYFGPAGPDKPNRSHSGRAGGQDPSLTPITERSEWSQRNSMISLAHGGSYPPGIHSQGLAQLADSLQHEEQDDMSLSALMKLRRGAWGSATSLHSSSGSQKGDSPPIHGFSSPPLGTGGSGVQLGGGAASIAGSGYNLGSPTGNITSPSEASMPGSLTSPVLRVNTQDLILSPTHGIGSGSDTSPKRRNAVGKGHSRNSSGAESVSYFKENHEDGSGRWVVEKRRTGEGGQIEVLGRQVVDGGRI